MIVNIGSEVPQDRSRGEHQTEREQDSNGVRSEFQVLANCHATSSGVNQTPQPTTHTDCNSNRLPHRAAENSTVTGYEDLRVENHANHKVRNALHLPKTVKDSDGETRQKQNRGTRGRTVPLAKRNKFRAADYATGLALLNGGCKQANRKNRAIICRATYHGVPSETLLQRWFL